MKQLTALLLSFSIAIVSHAQTFKADKNSFIGLNSARLQTNKTGMTVLSAWGAANVVGGVTGMLIAKDKEWKSFHEMNALWGAVNMGIGVMGYMGNRREAKQALSCDKMLARYESNKRLFLINAGLDVAYIGTGVALAAYADEFKQPDMWRGFGKSIAFQGIFLLLFDGTMYAMHAHHNKQWYKLLDGVCVTGNGIGVCYLF